MATPTKTINEWYAENIDRFPELVEGECDYCGEHPMMIDRGDTLECYHCGDVSENDDR